MKAVVGGGGRLLELGWEAIGERCLLELGWEAIIVIRVLIV